MDNSKEYMPEEKPEPPKKRRFKYLSYTLLSTCFLFFAAYNQKEINDNEILIQAVQLQITETGKKVANLEGRHEVLNVFEWPEGTKPCLCILLGEKIDQEDTNDAVLECPYYPTCGQSEIKNCEKAFNMHPEKIYACKRPSDW